MSIVSSISQRFNWFFSARARLMFRYRGYRALKHQNRADLVQRCKYQTSVTSSPLTRETVSALIFLQTIDHADLVVRQYLAKRVGEGSICNSIYNAVGGGLAIHNLPPHLFPVLRHMDIPVNRLLSRVHWHCNVLFHWLYGCWTIGWIALSSNNKLCNEIGGKTAYFHDLPANALPRKASPASREDLITWYVGYKERDPAIQIIGQRNKENAGVNVAGISIRHRKNVWHGFAGEGARMRFAFWGFKTAGLALYDHLRGRWWHSLLLSQAAMAKMTSLLPKEAVPAEIWLTHENYKFKPIWVTEAEAKGSKCFLYFYSVNNQTVQPEGQTISISGYWHLMNWSRCVVWNRAQETMLRKFVNAEMEFIIVGYLPFTDSDVECPIISSPSIAFFDVPCYNIKFCLGMGQAHRHVTDRVTESFYDAAINIALSLGVTLAIKRKSKRRKSHLTSRYQKLISRLNGSPLVLEVHPEISAERLIARTDITISAPYSSTALIAATKGKPSCYFDPTATLPSTSKFSHGIKIIRSKEALLKWVQQYVDVEGHR